MKNKVSEISENVQILFYRLSKELIEESVKMSYDLVLTYDRKLYTRSKAAFLVLLSSNVTGNRGQLV